MYIPSLTIKVLVPNHNLYALRIPPWVSVSGSWQVSVCN